LLRNRIEAQPLAIRGDMRGADGPIAEYDIGGRHHVLPAVLAPTQHCEPAPGVTVVVDFYHLDRLTDHEGIARQSHIVLERLAKRPELLIFRVSVSHDFVDARIEILPGETALISRLNAE